MDLAVDSMDANVADDRAGELVLGFATRDGRTELSRLRQAAPLRAFLPCVEPGDPPVAVVVNTSGGVVGGDRLTISVSADAGARATVTAQAAEKVYRSRGPSARIETRLDASAGSLLEWLPQETILFDRARLERRLEAHVAAEGRILLADMLVFGRTAHGERLTGGSLRDLWRIRVDGRLVWADGFGFDGDVAARLADPFGFAGRRAGLSCARCGRPGRIPRSSGSTAFGEGSGWSPLLPSRSRPPAPRTGSTSLRG